MKSPDYYIGPHAPHIDASDIVFQYHLGYWDGGAVAHILRAGYKPGETEHAALTNALGCVRRQIEYVEWSKLNSPNHDEFVQQANMARCGTAQIEIGDIRRSFGLSDEMHAAILYLLVSRFSPVALRWVEKLLIRAIEACEGADPL